MRLLDRLPAPPAPPSVPPRRGRPRVYSDGLFLKGLVIMIVRRLNKAGGLLAVLEEPTEQMRSLRELLGEDGRFPSRRTFERRLLRALPERIGLPGRHLVALIEPWARCGRAVAIDSTVLRTSGGVWHKILIEELPYEARFAFWGPRTTTPRTCAELAWHGICSWWPADGEGPTRTPTLAWRSGASSCTGHVAIENLNEHFKAILEAHGEVPTKGSLHTARFALGAVFVYQLALLYRHEQTSGANRGLKAFLRAARAIMTTL